MILFWFSLVLCVVLATLTGNIVGDWWARRSAKRALRALSRHDGGAPLPFVPSPSRDEYQKLMCAWEASKDAKEHAQSLLAQLPQPLVTPLR